MKRYVARGKGGEVYPVYGTLSARFFFGLANDKINRTLLLMTITYFISPFFFVLFSVYLGITYYQKIKSVFFLNDSVKGKYKELLRPVVSKKVYSVIGYRVYPEELNDHLALINSDDKEDMKKLGKKQKKMRKIKNRLVGFDIDRITRHVGFIGSTGAGKTETLMSFFEDIISAGGSIGMIDGKSDQPMEYKIYNVCREHYCETQFYAIILNKPEKGTNTNTYSPLLSYESAAKASEFLGEFLGGGGGDGHDYFVQRGKVMLGNIVLFFKNRQRYYHENFSITDLRTAVSPLEINNIYYLAHGIMTHLELLILHRIEVSSEFASIMRRAGDLKTPQIEHIRNCELLYEFINQNSHLSKKIETILGINYKFFTDHFDLYVSLSTYMRGISPNWGKYTFAIGEAVEIFARKREGRSFLYNQPRPVRMTDVRRIYEQFRGGEGTEEIIRFVSEDMAADKQDDLKKGLGIEASKETAESISPDNMIQHQYAEQQWTRLFDLFKMYNHIYGTPNPEVDGEDIVKNNKNLYTMLPVMELSEDQVKILGQLHILMFKNIASLAIGGDRQEAMPIQFKIYQNKIKPNPLYLMVLDEIGSYVSEGLSVLLSQVRSLRIGMILSGQDEVSLKPKGNDAEQARVLANIGKIVLKNRDKDIIRTLEELLPDIEVVESKGLLKSAVSDQKIITTSNVEVVKQKPFDLKLANNFAKGFGVYIDDIRDEPVFFQSFYLGDNTRYPIQIRRFDSYENVRRSF